MFHRKKRGKQGVYYVYWRENGRQRSKAVSSNLQTVKIFEKQLTERLYAKKNGLTFNNFSFDELCEEYMEYYSKPNKKPRSIVLDKSTIRNFQNLCPEVRKVRHFNDMSVNTYKMRRKSTGVKDSTVNRELGTLKTIFRYFYNNNYSEQDYSSDISFFKVNHKAKDFVLSSEMIKDILEVIKVPYKTAFLLALYAGLRRGEACHLEWNDVDFENSLLNVTEKPHLKWAPKNRTSIRKVPIHSFLKEYLLELKEQAGEKTNFVCFSSSNYKRLDEGVLTSTVTKMKRSLNLPKEFCFHALRHTFVSKMSENGMPSYHISKIIGHSSSTVTEQIYTHLKDTAFFSSIKKLNLNK
ncbi:MAG: site-specific integrase [bacterium]|nr:site-specific integrase [bacterium]